jgi:hypothetical protein
MALTLLHSIGAVALLSVDEVLTINPVWLYLGVLGGLLFTGAVARIIETARRRPTSEGGSGAIEELFIILFWWLG